MMGMSGTALLFIVGIAFGAFVMDDVYSNRLQKIDTLMKDNSGDYIVETYKYRECERLLTERSEL